MTVTQPLLKDVVYMTWNKFRSEVVLANRF